MDKTNDTNNTDNLKEENNVNKIQNKVEEKMDINTNKNEGTKPKSNFVPSYKRSKEDIQKQESNINNKKNKKGKIFKSKITIGIIVAVVVVLVLVCALIIKNINANKISDYNKLMDDYGLSVLYNNQTSTSTDTITKSEAIKVIIAATLNTEDITLHMPDSLLYTTSGSTNENVENTDSVNLEEILNQLENRTKVEEVYTNEYWVKYAESVSYITENEINNGNYNEEITYLDAIKYISNAKTVLLGKNLDIDTTPKFKDYDKYDNETKWMLSDLVYNGIIEDTKNKLNGEQKITKEEFNKLVINFVLKYNLITINDEKININEDKMPSNKDEFAYTLANVDKKVYEIENYKANEGYKTPIEVFAQLKSNYQIINTKVENYYNALLNIDYETITVDSLYSKIVSDTMYMITEEQITEYVEYVKTNKIKITGEAKVQNPIIYFDGENYRVRTKISYNIESADNLENVFLLDKEAKYNLGKDEIYIDAPIYEEEIYNTYYIVPTQISKMISGSIK